jgi:hypothetical protein
MVRDCLPAEAKDVVPRDPQVYHNPKKHHQQTQRLVISKLKQTATFRRRGCRLSICLASVKRRRVSVPIRTHTCSSQGPSQAVGRGDNHGPVVNTSPRDRH